MKKFGRRARFPDRPRVIKEADVKELGARFLKLPER